MHPHKHEQMDKHLPIKTLFQGDSGLVGTMNNKKASIQMQLLEHL